MKNSLPACIACLSMNVKLYSLSIGTLRCDFQMLTGIRIINDGLPEYLCFECVANVKRFVKFRDKCHRAFDYLLLLLSESPEINSFQLLSVNRQDLGIKSSLTCSDVEKTDSKQQAPVKSTKKTSKKVLKQNCQLDICDPNNTNSDDDKKLSEWEVEIDNKTTVKDEVIDEDAPNSDPDDFADENDEVPLVALKNSNDISNDIDNVYTIDNKPAIKIEEEYAYLYPISIREAKAAAAVSLLYLPLGDYRCTVCKRSFKYEKNLTEHLRMHDPHTSGSYHCDICKYYYRTEGLLQTHTTEKHMYKYICKQCHEVNFDRSIAKKHYVLSHLKKRDTVGTNWFEIRPKWLKKKSLKRQPKCKTSSSKPIKKRVQKAMDELLFNRTAISQEEQYRMVTDRMTTHNYLGSLYKCEYCFKGFRKEITYNKHMIIHDPAASGKFECDMCKWRGKNTLQMLGHMKRTHLYKYSCRLCEYVCYNISQVYAHDRWHNNVTYPCSFCDRVFTKESSRLSHIRVNHPSLAICRLCGHSFINELGLKCHVKRTHQNEVSDEPFVVDKSSDLYCAECEVQFANRAAFDTHLGSSNKHVATNVAMKFDRTLKDGGRKLNHDQNAVVDAGKVASTNCELCGKHLPNDVEARKHYKSEHPGAKEAHLKRHMCDVCGYTTKSYDNLIHHIRSHSHEKPYKCPHCSKMFSRPGNMKRHLDVHTGEKRYVCEHCSRRFAQKKTMEHHVLKIHIKKRHPPSNKRNRKRKTEPKVGLVPPEAPACSTTTQKMPTEIHADYYSAYVNSFNNFLG